MAVLYISEFEKLATDINGKVVPGPMCNPIAEQKVDIAGATAASNAFNARTRFVMVHTDANCHLAFGAAPEAATTAHRMAAGETRFYGVSPDSKIAVIAGA